MPSKGGFQLTEDDVRILKLILEYRMLRIDHLAVLSGRAPKKIHGRLLKLVQRRYLARVVLPLQKHLYFLGTAGIPVLVEQGMVAKELLDWRLRHHELKELFLRHLLMVVDVHAILATATRGTPIELVRWQEGKGLWDKVSAGHVDLPVRPDGFFALQDGRRPAGQNRAHFFLEADRSTTTHERFQQKVVAYWHYLQSQGHSEKHGIKSFRVLTVALTPGRAAGLCEATEAAVPPPARKFFLFGSMADFSLTKPTPILNAVFRSPRDWREGNLHPLIPVPVPPAP